MRIAIVGGGITGLSLGYFLAKKFHKVTVFEKEGHLGGLASVFDAGGFELERFYHHFFPSDSHLIDLIGELKLANRLVWAKSSMGFYSRGKIHPFTSPLDLLSFSPLSFFSRIRLGLLAVGSRMIGDWQPLSGIRAKDWLVGRIGEEAYSVVWEPLLISKFGKYHDQVPAAWVWGRLAARAGARGIGAEKLGYLKGGLGPLFNALAEHMTEIRLSSPVNDLSHLGAYDRVIFTIAPPLVKQTAGVAIEQAAGYLGNICVILKVQKPLSKYYWINIGDTTFPFCAAVEQNNAFDDEKYGGSRFIYLSRYTSHDDPLWKESDDKIVAHFAEGIKKIDPDVKYTSAFVFRDRYAQPLVTLNYQPPPFEIEKGRIYMVNNAQIYPRDRGLNDSIGIVKRFLNSGYLL